MFDSIFSFFRSFNKPSTKVIIPKKSQTIPEAWSVEKSIDHNIPQETIITSTPITRVERILDFSDDFVESITQPPPPSINNAPVESPHSSQDDDDEQIWDISAAICGNDQNEESDDDDIEINVDKIQSPSTFAKIKADALGTNRTACAARKPSLPPLSFNAMVVNKNEIKANDEFKEEDDDAPTTMILTDEPFKGRRKDKDDEETNNISTDDGGVVNKKETKKTVLIDYHKDPFEEESEDGCSAVDEVTSVQLFSELGERPEDSSPMSSLDDKSVKMETSCYHHNDEEWNNEFSDEEDENNNNSNDNDDDVIVDNRMNNNNITEKEISQINNENKKTKKNKNKNKMITSPMMIQSPTFLNQKKKKKKNKKTNESTSFENDNDALNESMSSSLTSLTSTINEKDKKKTILKPIKGALQKQNSLTLSINQNNDEKDIQIDENDDDDDVVVVQLPLPKFERKSLLKLSFQNKLETMKKSHNDKNKDDNNDLEQRISSSSKKKSLKKLKSSSSSSSSFESSSELTNEKEIEKSRDKLKNKNKSKKIKKLDKENKSNMIQKDGLSTDIINENNNKSFDNENHSSIDGWKSPPYHRLDSLPPSVNLSRQSSQSSIRPPCASPLTQWEIEDFPITDQLYC
jgi:hypothetical protein